MLPKSSQTIASIISESTAEGTSAVSSFNTLTPTEITYQNLEDLTVIWLDANINNTADCLDTKARLRSLINYLLTFEVLDQCTTFIKSVTKETIFLVVSGSYGETMVEQIHHLPQVGYIYVFCAHKARHEIWAKYYAKIRGVYDDKGLFLSQLSTDVKIYSQNSLCLSFLKNDMQEKSVRALSDEKAKFIWYQWLMETLIRMPQSVAAKMDMLNESRTQYDGQPDQLVFIKEFENAYKENKSTNAIWWYTRDCFLYRILNKALRTENIDVIFKYRFFLKDLYEQLGQTNVEQAKSSCSNIQIVYRGQAMSLEEIKMLSANVNGLISFNTFVSTSLNNSMATLFALDAIRNRPNCHPILFKITLLPSTVSRTTSQPYANITHMSAFPTEKEILLSLGTVCRLISIVESNSKGLLWWHVNLEMTDKENEELKALKRYIGLETKEQPTISDFGILFLKLGDLVRAEHYFSMMINKVTTNNAQNTVDQCELHNNMGLVYAQKGDPKTSCSYYQTALQLHTKAQSTGRALKLIPVIYSNIGYSYLLLKDWNASMRMFEKALHHLNKLDLPDEELRGTVYLNMATVALSLNDAKKADDNCENASTSWRKCFRNDHINSSKLYRVQGRIACVRRQYQNAIELHKKALDLHHRTLPSDHIQIAEAYEDLATTHSKMDSNTVEILDYYKKALDIYVKNLPSSHPTICRAHIRIGELYQNSNKVDEALQQYNKANWLSKIGNHADLHVTSLIKIVHVYLIKEKKDLAFYYALEAIEITLQAMPTNSPERPILRQILPLFRTIGQQPPSKQSVLYKMAEKLVTSSSIREIIINPMFSTCMISDNMSNMSAIEQFEVQDQKTLEALFKEDSIDWNEMVYS